MAVARLALTRPTEAGDRLSDEVELYQRTYTTLLRSRGETQLRKRGGGGGYAPTGCHAVFNSVSASIRPSESATALS